MLVSHTTLVSTDTLAQAPPDRWVVLDCRFDLADEEWGRRVYREGHVPGAQYVHLTHDMSAPLTGRNGRHPLPAAEVMAATFGRLGITRGTQVVVYDQDVGMYASRLWWMLRYMDHDAVAVLDGGWAKWTREERPTRGGDESRAAATFVGRPQTGWRVEQDEIAARVGGAGSALLVDARAPERFEGRVEPIDKVPGHIPGAINVPYKENAGPDGTLLSPSLLQKRYAAAIGNRPPDQVVMYCGSGVTACHNLLAMEHAGMRGARLYTGSWSEWSSDPSRPIETGPAKASS
jgi:thiosulfate/3-mercaptopyruvate sulfurtransferase